jgi:hypothetical protein
VRIPYDRVKTANYTVIPLTVLRPSSFQVAE